MVSQRWFSYRYNPAMSLNFVAIISAKQAPGATSAKACPRGRRFSERYFDEISLRSSRQLLRDHRAMELHRTGQAARKAKRVITIKVSSRYVIPSRCTKLTTSWHNYSYFIIHNFQQKAKPQCTLVDYFLFCPVSFLLFSDFVSYFQENFTFAAAYHTLSSQRVSLIQPS